MTSFTKWAFRNKAGVLVVTLIVLVMGITSYFRLPMEFLPVADNPQVSIAVLGQGNDAALMTQQVTEPIEKAVTGVSGKREIFSTTGDGFSKIDIHFEPNTNMKDAKTAVQEALANVQLPQNVSKPYVIQLNTSMIPISEVSLSFKDGLTKANLDKAEKEILPQFKSIKGLASVMMSGHSDTLVTIQIDNKKAEQAGVQHQAIMGALQGRNVAAAVGEKTIDGSPANIKVLGELNDLSQLNNVAVAPNVKLGDIAKIQEDPHEGNLTRVNGQDALFMIFTKDSHSNAVTVGEEVQKIADKINKEDNGAKLEVVLSTADSVKTSVDSMMREVLMGALFATIVIMLFLRNLRSTFITIVSIPLSLGITLFLLHQSGVTLNILTLGGVAVAVGRLVDDSIVVIENIFRRAQKEKVTPELVIDATKEVASAITSSTLTTVAVFLPIALVGGGLQQFLKPFALTVTYSLISSLLVALTVVPVMSAGLLKNAKLSEHRPAKRFRSILTWSLNRKWIVILLALLVLGGSIGTYANLPKGDISNKDAEFVMVALDYPNNTPISTVRAKALQLESFLVKQDQPKYVVTQMGNSTDAAKWGQVQSPTKVTFSISMKKNVDADAFMKTVREQAGEYSGAKLTAETASLMGASAGSVVTLDVVGNDQKTLEASVAKIQDSIKGVDGVLKIETNQDAKKPVYTVKVDGDKANPQQVMGQLGMMMNRMPIGTMSLDGKQAPVMLEPMVNPSSLNDLKNVPVMSATGPTLLSNVASIERTEQSTSVLHKGGNPYIRLSAVVDSKKLSVAGAEIDKIINGDKTKKGSKGIELPKGVTVFVGGASAQQASDFADLFVTMGVSIALVYLIMVLTFKSIRAPIAILMALPLAAIGAVLGIVVSRISVDMTALLGALMLIGVVVTNAIVLIDRVKHNEQSMIIRDALVEAAATRMRPIFMTAVATICAMLPLLFKKAESGSLVSTSLAVVVIGGLAVATVLTLIVVPVVYEMLHFRKSKKQRAAAVQTKTAGTVAAQPAFAPEQ